MGSDTKEKPTIIEISAPNKRERPRRDCLCRVLNIFTSICALLCLVGYAMHALELSLSSTEYILEDVCTLVGMRFWIKQ